jgi:2-polyprenyl-6-methoxyphenol hydroxylase-like FAD-dependent oxidoreductase
MVDVAIAGGGIAGSTLAIFLGRQGLSVELFERGEFPKEKACGEGLMPGGIAVLQRLGLADAIGGAPFHGVRYHLDGLVAEGRFPSVAHMPAAGYGQRRSHLDQTLFQAAAATPGVSVHTGAPVSAPLVENGRVVGLLVNGQPHRASIVVAADGSRSPIRHALALDAPTRRKRFGMRAHFRLPPGKDPATWVDVFVGSGHELYVTPLPNREFVVAALADVQSQPHPRGESPERSFRRWSLAQPELAARLDGAQQVSDLIGASPLQTRARAGVAPGVVLLGDAAGSTDPITGGGMAQALMTSELLACYISSARAADQLSDPAWLWKFERDRRAMLRNYRAVTRMTLWLADHRRLAHAAIMSLRLWPALFSQLLGICSRVTPWQRAIPRGPAAWDRRPHRRPNAP